MKNPESVSNIETRSPMRIWNLRRGDHDDNRTSPRGGLRGVVLSAALEFNYLKAPIVFLTLVILPALLVGIAPSALLTYGRLMFHTAATSGPRPIFALALLAVLLGAALWIGRPLLSMAFDSFWHLHYSLITPMFMAFRELLRTIGERVRGGSMTPEQLDRTRRIGTILAALLLAGLALGLASLIEFSTGLKIVDVERVQPWEVAKAALGNAAIVLCLSTVAASMYWLWRELRLNSLVLDWVARPPAPESSIIRVAHLSDLHAVGERYGYRMEPGTHGPRGNRPIRNALRKLAAIHAANPLDRVLVTGDITDAGTRAEWLEFLDLLQGCPDLSARMSFVPGNHELNIVDRGNPGRLDLPWSASPSLRKLRFVLAVDAIQGDRTHVVNDASGKVGPLLKDYLREDKRAEMLRELAQRGTLRARWEMAKIWDAIFPLVEPGPAGTDYGVILLNSNAPSHFALTNAIGVVDPAQLKRLKAVLRNSRGRTWIVLLHHQVVEYPVTSISLLDRISLALVNAPNVLSVIAPYASHVAVLHGHRHRDWIGTFGDLILCSAPSVTLDSDGDRHSGGSFHIHEFARNTDGRVHLIATERVTVTSGAQQKSRDGESLNQLSDVQ
jgi:3',5'-cyclic AMP phosphodiesterase CpdA